ncbi:HEAT repeat domain-containing protein [Oscillatoria sp. FACHB-1406]|uniref:HEAT repeat domain-containing protein n=1 Tax=Oscillatoria sp. FACHB-1406 TaxID=2692846 RepID=UPI001684A1B2|nr:HEAT repeat domain-containing protein [Oscillatoria sp. FACHB-1406]MBD2577945.1 HEAT repeat domain-containing protein [Oscillatoria sp. FACHB-1406]
MMSDNTVNLSSLEREASSENTPAPRLTELAGQSLELARIVAKNITTPPTLLAELSTSEDRLTRQNVTQNPNTSLEVLFELGAEFPDEFFDNPVCPLLPLENPNWVEMLPEDTIQTFLSHHRAQQALLEGFRNHPHPYQLFSCWKLEIHDLPTHWLEEFSRSIDEDVRYSAAGNPKTPVSLLKQLSQDTSDRVRHGVANNPKTPVPLLKQLSQDTSYTVRRSVANNPKTSVPLLKQLSQDTSDRVRHGVAKNLKTPVSILKQLSQDTSDRVRYGIAENLKTPVSILKQLLQDTSEAVRESVANNPKTPVSLLKQLSQDTSDRVRDDIAINPKTPISYLETLATDLSLSVRNTAYEKSKGRMGEYLQILWR